MTKIGRNDPCPCGSGKKYKKCHGGRVTASPSIETAWENMYRELHEIAGHSFGHISKSFPELKRLRTLDGSWRRNMRRRRKDWKRLLARSPLSSPSKMLWHDF
jgi:hypothetical protein